MCHLPQLTHALSHPLSVDRFSVSIFPSHLLTFYILRYALLLVHLQDICTRWNFETEERIVQFDIEFIIDQLDAILIAIGIVGYYPNNGKRIFSNGDTNIVDIQSFLQGLQLKLIKEIIR